MNEEQAILQHFFTNSDKPVYALKNMPPAVQSYFYMGVSRFPEMRQRFVKMLQEKGCLEKAAEAAGKGNAIEQALQPLSEFAAEKNSEIFFSFGHRSAGEGNSLFLISEDNPIYATEEQQDFFFPLTTMELSTRYSRKFSLDRVHWDPVLMKTEFASKAKQTIAKNLALYEQGMQPLMDAMHAKNEAQSLPERVAVLDSLRFLIPIACCTSVVIGGNARALLEHFGRLLASRDSFVKGYAEQCVEEAKKVMPEYFSNAQADSAYSQGREKVAEIAGELFGKKFSPVKETVSMHQDLPSEELVIAQLLYPHCSLTFKEVFDSASGLSPKEKEAVFRAANSGRQSRQEPLNGLETRPIVFEIESPWAFWKDLKRHRMNLRFHQPMRGLSGFDMPELAEGSAIESDYRKAMQKTTALVEKVFQKHGGVLSKTVAAQGNRKRFILCMGVKQLTVLAELRTTGEGDKGYRRIASKMIELAKEKNPRLFGHINDNFKRL